MLQNRQFPAPDTVLDARTATASPGPFWQALPPRISVPAHALPALAAAEQDAAEPPAPRGGVSPIPSVSSRHQFHVESSHKRSVVLNAKITIFSMFVTLK